MPDILHITPRERWEQAVVEGESRSDDLATEGFVLCCLSGQLSGVVRRYFKGQTGLVVLRIDPDKLKTPLKRKNPSGSGEAFPHDYGPLNVDAVAEVLPPGGVLGG